MSSRISNSYDAIVVGCGIAGSVVGAILSNMEHKKVLILEASSKIGGRATSFRGEGMTDADEFRKTLAQSAHSWVSDRTEPDLSTLEFMFFTAGDTCILWRHPEDEWVDVKCPTVEGLFFAGDTYGKRVNEGGSKVLCIPGLFVSAL